MPTPISLEATALWSGVICYCLATILAVISLVFGKKPEKTILGLMSAAWLLHTLALASRWIRIDHLPVGNTYEALSANVWGMMAAAIILYYWQPRVRTSAAVILPIILMVLGWMSLLAPDDSTLPPTYDTIWLFIHIALIKIFLGATLAGVGCAGIILARAHSGLARRLAELPSDSGLEELSYRLLALGMIFDTLGVVAGAIWARDAWGRYWSWDPLETWSFLTWLTIALALHLRVTFHPTPRWAAVMVIAVFVIAFLTFFGVPFVSESVHKGAI